MRLEHGQISSGQLTLLFMATVLSTVIITPIGMQVGQDVWIMALISLAEAAIVIWLFSVLSTKFPGKTFVEISELVFGKYLGKIISAAYLWFVLHIGSLIMYDFSAFLLMAAFRRTPSLAFEICLLFLSVLAVYGGIEVISRVAQILIPLFVVEVATTLVLSISIIDLENFLPMLTVSPQTLLIAAHESAMHAYGESVVLLMIIPFLAQGGKSAPRAMLKGLIAAGMVVLAVVFRNVGVLGVTTSITTYHSLTAVKEVNIGQFLTRLDILVAITSVTVGFLSLTVFLYGAVLGTGQLFGLRSYSPVVIPVAVLMLLVSHHSFSNIARSIESIRILSLVYHPVFEIVIPGAAFLVAKVRRLV